jgi:hypothetical protein
MEDMHHVVTAEEKRFSLSTEEWEYLAQFGVIQNEVILRSPECFPLVLLALRRYSLKRSYIENFARKQGFSYSDALQHIREELEYYRLDERWFPSTPEKEDSTSAEGEENFVSYATVVLIALLQQIFGLVGADPDRAARLVHSERETLKGLHKHVAKLTSSLPWLSLFGLFLIRLVMKIKMERMQCSPGLAREEKN